VWETLEHFGPTRIGHGVRSYEDAELVKHIAKHRIHLEVCPTCNVQTNIYDTIQQHPVDKLYREGVSLNINTDCRTIVNTNLKSEYEQLEKVFGWTSVEFYQCNVNAIHAAFIPDEIKAVLLEKLKKAYAMD
jgi:adenosine deaminase